VEDTSEVNEETEPVPPLNDFRFRLFRWSVMTGVL
jgi:hypothetical protein